MAEGKKAVYRTFVGVVQFDPQEREAGGKDIRSVVLRTHGVKEQSIRLSCTLWPSHAHVEVEKGDAVVVEGKFEVNPNGKDKEGNKVTYFNLSVSGIRNLGALDFGEEIERENAASEYSTVADDDIPF